MRENVALWPVGFNLLSYKKSHGRDRIFAVRFWYLLREFCWEPESVWYVSLWQHIHYPERKNSSRKEISLCGYSCSACYLTEERFRGISPWKNYHLMDNIFGLVLGTGLQVFNVILAVNSLKNLPTELEEA